MSLSFIDDLEFMTLGSLVKKIIKIIQNDAKVIPEFGKQNVVIYNISITKFVFF